MNTETVTRWMRACALSISEQRDYLTQLDAAIGDADHGANMTRGRFSSTCRSMRRSMWRMALSFQQVFSSK